MAGSGSETRRAGKSILVRCTAEDYALLEKALEASMAGAPAHATTSMAKFVLTGALEKARAIVSAAPKRAGR